MLANLKFMILNLCILYVKKLKIYKEKSQKNKASEHLYFKEQGQKDIKVQVVIRTFTFLKISLSNALKNQNKLQL